LRVEQTGKILKHGYKLLANTTLSQIHLRIIRTFQNATLLYTYQRDLRQFRLILSASIADRAR